MAKIISLGVFTLYDVLKKNVQNTLNQSLCIVLPLLKNHFWVDFAGCIMIIESSALRHLAHFLLIWDNHLDKLLFRYNDTNIIPINK